MPDFLLPLSFKILAISSAIFAAIANIIAKTILKKVNSQDIVGINFLIMAGTMIIFSPLFYHFEISYESISCLIFIVFFDTIANYYFFKTFEKTDVTVATPILSIAPLFVFLFSWFFLNEKISIFNLSICFLITLCIVFLSFELKNFQKFKNETLLPAFFTAILFSITAIPTKFLLHNLNAVNPPTLYLMRSALIGLLATFYFKSAFHKISVKEYRWIFLRGIVVIFQWLFLYFALIKVNNTGKVFTLSNTTPIFVIFLALIFLREKINTKKIIASVFAFLFSFFLKKDE